MSLNEKQIKQASDRLAVLAKIEEYEKCGWFDRDVEEDPPGKVLHPEDIKYLDSGFSARAKRNLSFAAARLFFRKMLKKKQLVLHPTEGVEHLAQLKSGAVITCNHFNAFDSFVMQKVFDDSRRRGKMHRVIREGNYTAFPGFYGMLMRNCDTLPLSSDPATMKKFLRAVRTALDRCDCVLIYAEQSMWWNYRKPKPMKLGAFEIAVRSGVPVVPCFITLADNAMIGADGFPIQEYTPHVGTPIYPDLSLPKKEAAKKMREENARFCKETYERIYGIPLTYTTETE